MIESAVVISVGLWRLRLFSYCLGLVVYLSLELNAQTTTSGSLAGIVTDQSGAVVPDAVVQIKDNNKGRTQSTKTDFDGAYRFYFLAPDVYVLTVAHDGFREERRTVDVLLGPTVTVNVTLQIPKAISQITVTNEAPLIQAENGDFSATMSQLQISELPNPGNDITYIAQTAPGMVMNTENQFGANFSSLGMSGTSNLFTVDGLNQNDNEMNIPLVGASLTLLGQNQIQEATVVSVGYSGQFGGAAGANVNYVTKSGSNTFHGNAQYYWNGRVLNANDWFLNALGEPRPFDIANQWAGSVGGPVKKNSLFFFFDTEGLHLLIPQLFYVTVPSPEFEGATVTNIDSLFGASSASDAFYRGIFNLYNSAPGASSAQPGGFNLSTDPTGCTGFQGPPTSRGQLGVDLPCAMHFVSQRGRPTDDILLSGRMDWILGKNDRAFLRVQNDTGHNWFYLDPISPSFDAGYGQSWWQGQIIENHVFNSTAASQFLLTGMYFTNTDKVDDPSKVFATLPTTLNFNNAGTFSSVGAANNLALPTTRPTTEYQTAEDVVKNWRRHKLGVGASFERIDWTSIVYTLNSLGTLSPQTLRAFYQGGVDAASPTVDFTALTQSFPSETSQRIAFYNLGFYAQDEWNVRSALTLNLALRAEHYSNPVCRRGCFARMAGPFDSVSHDPAQPYNQAILVNEKQAFQSLENVLWSPRFSFAWQPFGVRRDDVLRGGFGVFYDPVPGHIAVPLSSNPPLLNSYTIVGDNLTPGERTSLFKDAAASNAAFMNGFAAGQTLAQIQATVSSLYPPGFSPPAITVPPAKANFPEFQRWSLEWQQAVGKGSSFSVGYFGHHGIHELVQNPGANAYGFGSLPASLCASPPVPPCADPRFSEVTQIATNAVSNYNGMVASFQHRLSGWGHGVFQANYTYSHAFDEVSNGGLLIFTFGSSLNPQDPQNLRGAYGPAEYDVRHSFNANYVWEVPLKAAFGGHGPDVLMKGWQISGTVFARTGFPYTVFDNFEPGILAANNNYFAAVYAVPVRSIVSRNSCGRGAAYPVAPKPCQPSQLLADQSPNPNANFVQAGCETGFNQGNLGPYPPCLNDPAASVNFAQGRNRFRGPSYFNTDLAVMKSTRVPRMGDASLTIGFQFFNLFNHPNFSLPDIAMNDPTFGQILGLEQPPTGILGAGLGGDVAPRMIQLKVELKF
jgi:hypothetical protein